MLVMAMNTVAKLLKEAQALPAQDQLRLISSLCEQLRAHLRPQTVALGGRWAGLPFDETGMDETLRQLHKQSWQHLEEEGT
jgi:hypothetical protein